MNTNFMRIETPFLHNECSYYISEFYIGFRRLSAQRGDYYIGKKYAYNTLVFMLDGEVEFSYNEYVGRRFKKGDMVFIPHASHIYWQAITDVNMLIHTYDLSTESFCSNCVLSRMKFKVDGLEKVEYDFQPLQMTTEIIQFAELINTYIASDYRCMHLHELKQKELFIIMQYAYSHKQMMEFFYPIIGEDIPFRTKVMKIAHEHLTVEEYAKRFNMSARNFARKFNAEFGETVYQWLLQRKIAQIKLRLSISNVSVADIIQEFKFADAPHFYRFCKDHFGHTSKEYTRLLRSKSADLQ